MTDTIDRESAIQAWHAHDVQKVRSRASSETFYACQGGGILRFAQEVSGFGFGKVTDHAFAMRVGVEGALIGYDKKHGPGY